MTDGEINRKFDTVAEYLAGLVTGMQQPREAQWRIEEHWE